MTKKRILIIEDDADVRNYVRDLLETHPDYTVSTAKEGASGLEMALGQTPDLVITDYRMPKLTGLEVMQAVRDKGLKTPFIIMTAEGSEKVAVDAMRAGVVDYLIKPFDHDELLLVVAKTLETATVPRVESDTERMLRLFEDLRDPLLAVDEKGKITLTNSAAGIFLTTDTPQAARGKMLKDVVDNDLVLDLILAPDKSETSQSEIQMETGQTFNVQVSEVDGIGRVAIFQDVTHLKELNRVRGEMVTSISHDLRSPLTAILSYVELLGRVGELTPQQQEFTEAAKQSVSTITALVNDLLELEGIEAGMGRETEAIMLPDLLKSVIEGLEGKAKLKNQRLSFDAANPMPSVHGVPGRLRRVFTNLIDNAIKYTPDEGSIEVRVFREEDQVLCRVKDSGIGIPPEDQAHIFERFYRVGDVKDAYEGSGLGLSIVKSIVETHNGRIWVESTPKQGTTFTVMLPVSPGSA